MPRPRRDVAHPNIAAAIKAVARQQMSERGTAGLSLRAIARELEITAPAIYNYYPRLDDLITALIVDAFQSLADAMQTSVSTLGEEEYRERILRMSLAYRQWAVEHPTDFQLIYGNPIPGYAAPAEITVPLARRPFLDLFRTFLAAWQQGMLQIPAAYLAVPPSIQAHVAGWEAQTGVELPAPLFCLLASGWARIHGLVLLELFHHLQPMIGDPAALYAYELTAFLAAMGLSPPGE